MLRHGLWIYGLGGLLVPFIGIKSLILLLTVCGLVNEFTMVDYVRHYRPFLFLLLITGGVYPLLTTALGQWWFQQANGSLIREGDTVRGSGVSGKILPAAAIFMVARRQQQKCPIIHRLLAGTIWQSVTRCWINR